MESLTRLGRSYRISIVPVYPVIAIFFSKASWKVGKFFGKNDGIYHEGGSQCEQWCIPSGGCIRSRSKKSFVLRAIIGRRCGPTGTRGSRGSRNFFPGTMLISFSRVDYRGYLERFSSPLEDLFLYDRLTDPDGHARID